MQHTYYVEECKFEKYIENVADMQSLWFYRTHLARFYNNYILAKHDPNGDCTSQYAYKRQATYWITYPYIFSIAKKNTHRQLPDENHLIGCSALHKCEMYIKAITTKIEVCLRNLLIEYAYISFKVEPKYIADFLVHKMNDITFPNDLITEELVSNIIGDICSSLNEIDSFLV